MHPIRFALISGIVMLATGVLALFPGLYQYSTGLPPLNINASYGFFLGFVAMNIVNKLALIGFGIAGIMASRNTSTALPSSIKFSRVLLYTMAPLAVLGLLPPTSTLFGLWPLFGNNVWIYGVLAALGAYFGFALPAKAKARMPEDNTRIRAA